MQKNKKQKAICFLLLFSISFTLIACAVYFLFWRHGKSFIWNYDGIKQHYAALCYLGRTYREIISGILSGKPVLPMFDFSLGMGEDIITTLNFYGLGDPLTLLAACVSEEKTEYLYNFLAVFRMYLAGLSFSWFCREKGRSYACAYIGALVYSFSGYALHVAVKHPFFVIPMVFLPVAVIGVDRVLDKKKNTLLIVIVFLTALNGFYFFYMNTIFLIVYALTRVGYRNFVLVESKAVRLRAFFKDAWFSAGSCLFSYGVGTAMAGVLFVPAIAAYLTSARSKSAFDAGNLMYFDSDRYLAILTRVIGTPRITWDYLGMVSLILPGLILLFMTPRKKNRVLKANIIIWTAGMLLPFCGYMLNGFSYVSGRFMYLVTFVYAVGLVYALPEFFKMTKKKIFVCCGVVVVYLILLLISSDASQWYAWFGFAMLVLSLVVVAGGRIEWVERRVTRRQRYAILAALVSVNIVGNGWLLFSGKAQGYLDSFQDAGTAWQYVNETPEAEVSDKDNSLIHGFYRTESPQKRTQNTGMLTGKYGISSYFSISNPARIEYLLQMKNAGVEDSMFKIAGMDDRTWMLALASVGYYAIEKGHETELPYGYRKLREFTRGKKRYVLYENEYFLPLGVTYDHYMNEKELLGEDCQDAITAQEAMCKTLFLDTLTEKEPEWIEKESQFPKTCSKEVPFEIVSGRHVEINDGKVLVKKNGGSLTLRIKEPMPHSEWYVSLKEYHMAQKNRTYCDITAIRDTQKKTIRALTKRWNWYFGREQYMWNLGMVEESVEDLTVRIHFEFKGSFEMEHLKMYQQSMEDYAETIAERKAHCMENVVISMNEIQGTVDIPSNQFLFLSVPYSGGWSAWVNGEKVPVYRANTAYMALPLKQGKNEVRLSYETPYLRVGVLISLLGVLVFLTCEMLEWRKVKKQCNVTRKKEKEIGV